MKDAVFSLKELLRLCFSEPLHWLSDEPVPDPLVYWVALNTADVQKGDILLLPEGRMTPKIAEQIQKREGVAVILLGETSSWEPATTYKFPVVKIPSDQDIREVYRAMVTILVNQRAYLMERGVRIHAQLAQLEAEGAGIEGLAKAMFELSGRGILVQDKRLEILAQCPSSALGAIWEDILTQLDTVDVLPRELRDRKEAGQTSAIFRQEIPGGLERLVAPISVGGVARGYLSFVDIAGSLDSLDYLVAEQGALVCAVEMARTKAVREAEKRLKGDLLTALLQENITPRDANLWIQSMGLDLTHAHTALRFAWNSPSPPSRRRLETLINGEVAHLGLKVLVRSMGTEVVCFCQIHPDQSRPDNALALGEAVLERGKQEYPEIPMSCGVGSPAPDLGSWRDSFRQAGQALEMARRLRERRTLYFPDLSVYRLLLQLEYHPELQTFKQEILGPLLAYEGGSELLRTLEAYFDNNGNLSQAAEALYIHRNTLIYRMERIAEISGLDLDNTETRLAVQLALRIHRMTDNVK